MPGFVIDKFAEAKASLGTYPRIRGSDELRKCDRRLDRPALRPCRRDIDFAREVLPLNGSREGLFFAALPAVGRKSFDGRARHAAAQPVLSGLPRRHLRHRLRAGLSQRHRRDRPPARSRRAGARARHPAPHGRPSTCARPPTRRARSPGPTTCARRWRWRASYDFMLFFDECYSEIYTREPPTGGLEIAAAHARALQEPRRLQLAVQALEPARPALGLRRRRRRFPRDAGRDPQPRRRRRCRAPCSMPRRRSGRRSSTSPSSARPIAPSSTSATSCWRAASAIAGRAAASSCGST